MTRQKKQSPVAAKRKPPSKSSPKPTSKPARKKSSRTRQEAGALAADFPPTPYLFFGGKGGVGKTTSAVSAALLLLDHAAPGERILIFSTDPAHSLSDSLDTKIGDRLVEVARGANSLADDAPRLYAREMDAPRALEEFKTRHRTVLKEIADRGTLLDDSDINELLDLSLPGMDEVMSLFELSELAREGGYARIIVDTAPSGHTSRMLRLPAVFTRWTAALDRMNEKHRYMLAHFVRGARVRQDEVEIFLRDLAERIRAVREVLFNPVRTSFTLVTIPEAMSVEESVRYFKLLRDEGVPVTDLIVNRVEHEHKDCRFCRSRARAQKRWLDEIEHEFAQLRIRRVPLLPSEVRGAQSLRRFAQLAWTRSVASHKDKDSLAAARTRRAKDESLETETIRAGLEKDNSSFIIHHSSLSEKRLLIFGGKGGVGKTTAAASTALALAESDAARRILVFSTDPAHSLSDSFDEGIGLLKKHVAGLNNLDAMEIDPAARFEELKERYRRWTDELFDSITAGSRFEVQFDREAMRELVSLAPPGIDEIAALSAISDLVDENAYTTIVLDTAPTGHLVRFLELPEVALSWVHTFIKLMLKYKGVVRYGNVAEELIALSKSIKRVAAMLTDDAVCEFIGVAIAERMSLEETARLASSLKRLRVRMRRLLVNNVVTKEAAGACEFCAARRAAQTVMLKSFAERFAGAVELLVAPQHPYDVHGPELLREHFARWLPIQAQALQRALKTR